MIETKGKYILNGHVPVEEKSLLKWALWMEEVETRQIVKQESVGKYWISTIFTGMDDSRGEVKPPLLFETIVIKSIGGSSFFRVRCATWEEAETQHDKAASIVRDMLAGKEVPEPFDGEEVRFEVR